MLKIEKIYVWSDSIRVSDRLGDIEVFTVAEACYSNGNIVKWNDHCKLFPKTVQRFLDEHDRFRINDSCVVYADYESLDDLDRRDIKYHGC